jgi:hypothetical protein
MKIIKELIVLIICAMFFMSSNLFALTVGVSQKEPRLVDKNTKFHRLFVVGEGDDWIEKNGFLDDTNELKEALETDENQADGSTKNEVLVEPKLLDLIKALNKLKDEAEPGDEVTFYFGGHGNYKTDPNDPDWFEIKLILGHDVELTKADLENLLKGFKEDVTLVVVLDACYGGWFADKIDALPNTKLIGPQDICPCDPPFLFGGLVTTVSEVLVTQVGDRLADENEDEIVTADEAIEGLEKKGYPTGKPDKISKPKCGKTKCKGFDLPTIHVTPSKEFPGTDTNIWGEYFAPNTLVTLTLYTLSMFSDWIEPVIESSMIGSIITDENGNFSFYKHYDELVFSSSPCLVTAADDTGNWTWFVVYNLVPEIPELPEGTTFGVINKQYVYTSSSIDYDGDELYYLWDWGDGTFSDWLGPYDHSENCMATHNWTSPGVFDVKVKVKDVIDVESNWSDLLPVEIIIDNIIPLVDITQPKQNHLYLFDHEIIPFFATWIIGQITISADATDGESGIERVEFFLDGREIASDDTRPYECILDERVLGLHLITVIAYDIALNAAHDEERIIIYNIGLNNLICYNS